MAIPTKELQSLSNKSIIELYSITLVTALHGSTDVTRFHSGVGMKSNANIIWQGNTYTKFPVIAEGFEYVGRGTLPRPTLTVSNVLGTITALMATANATTPFNDLQGAKLIRHRTMAQFLDAANFSGGSNPFGTPDPNAEFERQIYLVDRKATENREIVEFELSAVSDLAGVRLPKRQCTRALFPAIGTFVQ